MSSSVLVDLVVVALLLLAAWSGWRTGAARTATSLLALALGLWISAQGQGAITQFLAGLLPGVDTRLIGLVTFIGGIWILLAIASFVIGRLLQASMRAIHLGPVDMFLGAALGVMQWSIGIALLTFIFDAAASLNFALPAPLDGIAVALAAAQTLEVIRDLIYPIAGQLFGGLLPEGLRAILVP